MRDNDTYERHCYPTLAAQFAAEGGNPDEAYFIRRLYGELVAPDQAPVIGQPSERDITVIDLISQGDTKNSIMAKLDVCEDTTKKAMASAINCFAPAVEHRNRRRLNAVKNAIETGLLPIEYAPHTNEAALARISLRQMTVFHLAELGHGNEYIANRMRISSNTVKSHLLHTTEDLGVKGMAEGVRAIREQRIFQVKSNPFLPRKVFEDVGIVFE